MNIITKKNVLISTYGPSEIHRVIIPKHSRNLKFKLFPTNWPRSSEAFKFFTKKLQFEYQDFYLNLPAIELIYEFTKTKDRFLTDLCKINMYCVFEENKKYYYPLFPNILSSSLLPRVCMGYNYHSAPEISEQLKIELIHKYSSDFFGTIFDLQGFDTYLTYAFNYFNNSGSGFPADCKKKIVISKSDVEKLIDYGCVENHNVNNIVYCFKTNLDQNYLMRLKNIITYFEWSQKSKSNKQYSIFDDFNPKSLSFDLPSQLF